MRSANGGSRVAALAVGWLLVGLFAAWPWSRAVGQAASSVTAACQNADSALARASALMEAQRFAEAATQLQPLAAARCDPRISLLLAAALEGTGNLPEAAQALQQAHTLWPENGSILTSLAREYLLNHQYEQAAEALRNFQPQPSTAPQELELGVEVYLTAHRLLQAQQLAELNFRFHPSVESLVLLANVLQLEGQSQGVVTLMAKRRAAYAGAPAYLITIAESEYDLGMYKAAHDDLQKAVTLQPGTYQAHYLLANTLVKQGHLQQAEAEYRAAIKLAPNVPRSYYQLALALAAENDDAGAKRVLAQALQVDSRYAPAYCEIGELLLREGQVQGAVEPLETAIRDNPDLEAAYFTLVRVYARLGRDAESKAMLARYLRVRAANRKKPEVSLASTPAPVPQ